MALGQVFEYAHIEESGCMSSLYIEGWWVYMNGWLCIVGFDKYLHVGASWSVFDFLIKN